MDVTYRMNSSSTRVENRDAVMAKLVAQEYVLSVPKGLKSAVWKIFLHIFSVHKLHKVDFVLCRYCYGLIMYKGYTSGTSCLINHSKICSGKDGIRKGSNEICHQEDWPEELKNLSWFTLDFLQNFQPKPSAHPATTQSHVMSHELKASEPAAAGAFKENNNNLVRSRKLAFKGNEFGVYQPYRVKGKCMTSLFK